jgi:hypothetical protein
MSPRNFMNASCLSLSLSFALALALPGCDDGGPADSATRVACGEDELCAPEDWQIDGPVDDWRATMGVSTAVCAGTIDRGSDGTIDASWTLEHEPGHVALLLDEGGDGDVDDSYDLDYDARFAPTHWAIDQGSDGEPEIENSWTYLLDGRLTGEELVIHRQVGLGLQPRRKRWSYFQDGHMVVTLDHGLDGVDEQRTIQVDAAGRPMFEETDRADADGHFDGYSDARVIRTFGVYGPIVRADISDRAPEQTTTFSYDDDGLGTGWTIDRNADGVVDATMTLTRDASGRLIRRQYAPVAPDERDGAYTIEYTPCASK